MDKPLSSTKKFGDVYRHIYFQKVSSRLQLSEALSISLPTVSQNLNSLSSLGLIRYSGEFESTGGRKANMISFVPEARYSVGVDITSPHVMLVLVNLCLDVVDQIKLSIPYENTPSYYEAINDAVVSLLEKNSIPSEQFLGVGISVPAIIDEDSRRIPSNPVIPVPYDLADSIKKYIRFPCRLINDANAAGWAETWLRNQDGIMAYLSLSYTVGGAFIINRQIYKGDVCRSAEFGHMTLFPRGRRCYCGKTGCVDAYCASKRLSDFTHGDIGAFFKEMKEGNRGLQDVFLSYLNDLAVIVNNLKMCFDCSIVLGGTMGFYLKDYIDEFREIACSRSPYEENADYIQTCILHNEPSAVGAGLVFIDQFIQSL